MALNISSLIICDDVRKETTGKEILIGVYSGTINVPAYPSTFPTALYVELEPQEIGTYNCQFSIRTPSGNPPFEFGFDMQIVQVETAVFVMGGIPMTLERDGYIEIRAIINGLDKGIIKKKAVRRVSTSPAT